VRPRGRYRRQREYPQPPPPTKNNTKITIKIVSIVSPLLGCLFLTLLEHVVCQNLWCEKGCRFRPLLSAYRGTRMKVTSHTSNRSTKGSNLIREPPLTNQPDLIRPDFRGAGVQFATRALRASSPYRTRNRSRSVSSRLSKSSNALCAPLTARISSSSLSWTAWPGNEQQI
jgi:hypothetical protein